MSLYVACNDRNAFFISDAVKNYNIWSCQKVCKALTFLFDYIYIRFGSVLFRQIVGIPMGTNYVPLVADFIFVVGGGRVVRWCWINFQCRGVLLISIRVGQGPTALAVGAGGGCLDICILIYLFLSSFSLSLGDGPI